MAKILVTGSTGFIGKRLVYQLLEQGHEVFALSRIKGIRLPLADNPRFHCLFGDLRDPTHMDPLPSDLDAAYFLVHSMGLMVQNLLAEEEKTAHNFISVIKKTNCKQIIYLGGIIEDEGGLSPHLRSRLLVEKVLKMSNIPTTILRASIIIGAGSASFEIIRDLVEKLPVMITPKWVNSFCQPIAIRDVLFYLCGVLLQPDCYGKTMDIGGPEVMTFKEVLLHYAAYRKLKRYILVTPFITTRLSSYWLVLITSVKFSICYYLAESMKHHTRKLNKAIDILLPHDCLTFDQAVVLAMQKIEQNEVVSTWMDAWNVQKVNAHINEFIQVPREGCLIDFQEVPLTAQNEEVQRAIWSIGGEKGWYSMNWAWKLRGLFDKLIGGAGLNRGRRHPTEIQVGDSIDFWRVFLADEKKGHLILYAEMKLPGEAWLEYELDKEKRTLKQTATFRPKGVFGRIYWYLLFPFHLLIFKKMAKTLAAAGK